MDQPLVSICCITYNHEKYIERALEGFLMQRTNFLYEIIVHDDASLDNTAKIIDLYAQKYPNIMKPIYQSINQHSQGKKISVNYVWSKARGKYIALCEGDDYWTDPYKLQKQVDFLEDNPEFSMSFTNYTVIDSEGDIIASEGLSLDMKRNLDYLWMLENNIPHTATIVFKRDVLPERYPQEYLKVYYGDRFLYPWIASRGGAGYVDINASMYCITGQGLWSSLDMLKRTKCFFSTNYYIKKIFTKVEEQRALNKQIRNRLLLLFDELSKQLGSSSESNIKDQFREDEFEVFAGLYFEIVNRGFVEEDFLDVDINHLRNREIYIFGAGLYGKKVFQILYLNKIATYGFLDNNHGQHYYEIMGRKVISPEDILNKHNVFIFIASTWSLEIEKQLYEMGFQKYVDFIVF